MSIPLVGSSGQVGGPLGYTYGALVARTEAFPDGASGPPCVRRDVVAALRAVRFSGWVGREEDGWVAAVPVSGAGTVASGRRGIVDVGGHLAGALPAAVLVVRVLADRQLLLVAWDGPDEVGRYVSDPSVGRPADDDTLPDPVGVEHAAAFAALAGLPGNADDLAELLAEELDPESVIESERLAGVLRLLGLPGWLVACSSLPRDVPAGPRAADLTRLRAGAEGVAGRLRGPLADVVRRRRRPADPVPDAPRGPSDADLWMLG